MFLSAPNESPASLLRHLSLIYSLHTPKAKDRANALTNRRERALFNSQWPQERNSETGSLKSGFLFRFKHF